MGLAKITEEAEYICRLHIRKCMLVKKEGYPDRLMHMSRVGKPVEFCESKLFRVRREYEADRDTVVAELGKETAE